MTFWHLKVYIAICKNHGNITLTAQELYVSQSRISTVLKEMETEFQTQFFDRIGKKLTINRSGEIFLDYADRMMQLYESTNKAFSPGQSRLQTIRIGSSVSLSTNFLPKYIAHFEERNENCSCLVNVNNAKAIIDRIVSNELDLAFVAGNVTDSRLMIKPMMRDDLVFISAPGNPLAGRTLTLSEILKFGVFALREQGSAARDVLLNYIGSKHYQIRTKWESTSTKSVLQAVLSNNCISCLPHQLVENDLRAGTISRIDVSDVELTVDYKMIYLKNKVMTEAMKSFIGEMSEQQKFLAG